MFVRLTKGSCSTEKFDTEKAQKLLECDRVNTFTECGWFIIMGYEKYTFMGREKEEVVVQAHTKSEEEYKRIMNRVDSDLFPEANPFYGDLPENMRDHLSRKQKEYKQY